MNVERLPLEDYEQGEDGKTYTTFRHQLKHTVGLDYADTPGCMYVRHGQTFFRSWRNHYDAGRIHPEFEKWVAAGLAEYSEYSNHGQPARTYRLTKKGLERLGAELNVVIRER